MNNSLKENREYIAPFIERIQLDNEISLQLQSTPPSGPGEPLPIGYVPEYFNSDPYRNV
jgi:hypothetical protein